MNIKNFEKNIEQKILTRGLDYYKSGYIDSIEYDNDEDEWIAEVSGSDDYTVTVKLAENGDITASYCDCPYDYGVYCKHQAAVFYSLRKIWEDILEKAVAKDNYIPPKSQPAKMKFEDIVKKAEKDNLVSFLLAYSKKNKQFKNDFMLAFSDKFIDKTDILDYARNLIKLSINKFSRGRFIEYYETEDALEGAEKVLDIAEEKGADNLFISANLCVILLEEMVKLADKCEDVVSVHAVIASTIICLEDMFEFVDEDSVDLEKTFDLIMGYVYDSSLCKVNSEWLEDILFIFVPFCHIKYIREKIENYLLLWHTESKSSSYDQKRLQAIQHEIIANTSGEDEARKFIEDNVETSDDFREKAINFAIADKNYEKAVKLCLDGEIKDARYPGLISKWKNLRYKIYEDTGNTADQKKLAYEFTIDGKFDYYIKLRNLYAESEEDTGEWYQIFEDILASVTAPYPKNIYTQILIYENMKPELLDYCKERSSFIADYYTYLLPDYESEVSEIFAEYLRQKANQASARSQYREVCNLIKKYITACGRSNAVKLVKEFKLLYAKRPAFVDELERV